MDLKDLERRERERQARNLKSFEESFNKEMKRKGDSRTLDDVMGIKQNPVKRRMTIHSIVPPSERWWMPPRKLQT